MSITLNTNVLILEDGNRRSHAKASEEYIEARFNYDGSTWVGSVPVEYRRTGVSINSDEELYEYLNAVYEQLNPAKVIEWKLKQEEFWADKGRAAVTKGFYDVLIEGGWKCVNCKLPPNPNWARRIQDLKEFGYTLATDTNKYCETCKSNKTHIMLLPIERGGIDGNGYETWTPALRKRILKVLGGMDVYECSNNPHSLPDHKFSEIRWGQSTKSENPDNMTDDEIRKKFQLLTNQRNQQKREVCRTCFQTGQRGIIFGIPFFHEGTEMWDNSIPKTGKDAEKGCFGCPWYDIEEWRQQLIERIGMYDHK